MLDNRVLAAINLHAVLRNLENLCQVDEEAQELIRGETLSLRFQIPAVQPLELVIKDGHMTAMPESDVKPKIRLAFKDAGHFNRMIEGKANPIPLSGFSKLSFLQNRFSKLAKRLESYLRPAREELDRDAKFRVDSTALTAYTAFFALAQVANYDRVGKMNALRIPDGLLLVEVLGGPSITLDIHGGFIEARQGACADWQARMRFDSPETARKILAGELDGYAAMGEGSMSILGVIPMLDNLNKLLFQVQRYLG